MRVSASSPWPRAHAPQAAQSEFSTRAAPNRRAEGRLPSSIPAGAPYAQAVAASSRARQERDAEILRGGVGVQDFPPETIGYRTAPNRHNPKNTRQACPRARRNVACLVLRLYRGGPMSGFSRTGFAARHRESGLSPDQVRRAWKLFLAVSAEMARLADRGAFPTPEDAAAFRGLIVRLKSPFPVRRACAQDVAGAALRIAQALGDVTGPQDRDELGGLLSAAVAFLDRLLSEDIAGAVERSRRISGDHAEPED